MPVLPAVSRKVASLCKGPVTPANPVLEATAGDSEVALRRRSRAAQPHQVSQAAGRAAPEALAEVRADPSSPFDPRAEAGPGRAAEARHRRALQRSTACNASSVKGSTAFAPASTTSTAIQS